MYVIDGTNIKLTRGDSFYCEVGIKRKESGEPYEPQAGDVVRFYLKRDYPCRIYHRRLRFSGILFRKRPCCRESAEK